MDFENFICAVPLSHKGIADYIRDSLLRKFKHPYVFIIKDNLKTNECEVWCESSFQPPQYTLDVMRGKCDWRA